LDQKAVNPIEPQKTLIAFNKCLVFSFLHGKYQEKRSILEIVASNLSLKDKKLNIEAIKPFRVWSKTDTFPSRCTFVEDVRTFFTSGSAEAIKMIDKLNRWKNIRDNGKLEEAA